MDNNIYAAIPKTDEERDDFKMAVRMAKSFERDPRFQIALGLSNYGLVEGCYSIEKVRSNLRDFYFQLAQMPRRKVFRLMARCLKNPRK